MNSRLAIYCDFDGTITVRDSVDFLLEHVAGDGWELIEKAWERGEIGSRECMDRQVALFEGGWPAIEKVLAKIEIDPSFKAFAKWCQDRQIEFNVVSDGIDRTIEFILRREGIVVSTVAANHLVEEGNSLCLEFPFKSEDKSCASGVCKCKILEKNAGRLKRVFIGDGRSDFCCAGKSDILFAKHKLATYCQESGISFIPFQSFDDIQVSLQEMFNLQCGESAIVDIGRVSSKT